MRRSLHHSRAKHRLPYSHLRTPLSAAKCDDRSVMLHGRSAALAAACVVLVFAVQLESCGQGGGARASTFMWEGPAATFRANCACCHGPNGEGGHSWIDPAYVAPTIAGYPPYYVKTVVRGGRPH